MVTSASETFLYDRTSFLGSSKSSWKIVVGGMDNSIIVLVSKTGSICQGHSHKRVTQFLTKSPNQWEFVHCHILPSDPQ
jgi:hypothetical protein